MYHTKNTNTLSKGSKNNFNDIVYTPETIVKDIMEGLKPYIYNNQTILDAFAGNKVFYNNYPDNVKKDGCEIRDGKDFFDYNKKVDGIITNPPYSSFTELLKKCFEISDNVVLLIPHNKIFTSDKRLDMIEQYGKFTYKRFKVPKHGTAKFPIAAYGFKKEK